jgi:hypothetical protein
VRCDGAFFIKILAKGIGIRFSSTTTPSTKYCAHICDDKKTVINKSIVSLI